MSRGIRNNNPGNIRHSSQLWRGEITLGESSVGGDAQFKSFSSMEWGYRAMFKLLHNYSVKSGCITLKDMITRWAPPSENNTQAYTDAVSRWSGIDARERVDTLNPTVMCPIVASMSRMENGVAAAMEDVNKGWRLFAQEYGL